MNCGSERSLARGLLLLSQRKRERDRERERERDRDRQTDGQRQKQREMYVIAPCWYGTVTLYMTLNQLYIPQVHNP